MMIHLRDRRAPGGERWPTFTGDLGRPGLPILRNPSPVPPADLLISECTYGGQTHEPVDETAERLGAVVRRTVERGGKVVIPAFSVGRTQTVVYFLHQLMKAGRDARPACLCRQPDGGAGDGGVPGRIRMALNEGRGWFLEARPRFIRREAGFITSRRSTTASP